jgi:hypothetical protein
MILAATLLLAVWFTAAEERAIDAWLHLNPSWAPAERILCTHREQLARQEQREPGYHPFRARGDFNGDGFRDVAVVVKSGERFALLVFNGDAHGTFAKRRAALLRLDPSTAPPYLFVHPRGALMTGFFESDVFFWVEPRDASYRLVLNGAFGAGP